MGGFTASKNIVDGPVKIGSNVADVHQITGSLHISGTLVANAYQVITTTTEQVHSSGSTIFGDTTDDIHQFTGSVKFNDDIRVKGDTVVEGSTSGSSGGTFGFEIGRASCRERV